MDLRFATIVYGDDGRKTMERLWQETVEEFDFVDVEKVLATMRDV